MASIYPEQRLHVVRVHTPFVGAFEADLFLSSNYNDVQKALQSGYAAASIVESKSKE